MPRQPRMRSRWGIGAIRLARAAAFLMLATGVAQVLDHAGYVFLAVIPVIAWFEGLAVAAPAVAAAALIYQFVFHGNGLMLAGAAAVLAVIAHLVRPRRKPSPAIEAARQPLALPPAPVAADPALEQELTAAKAAIADLQARIDEETQLHIAAANIARELSAKLERERAASEESIAAMTISLDAARTAIEGGREREERLEQSLAKAVAAVTETTTARMSAEDAHHHAVAAAAEEKARAENAVARLESRLAAERSRAAEAEQYAVKLRREVEELRQATATAEAAIADLTAREAALRQKGTEEAEQSRAALAELTASLEAERTRVADSEARAAKLQHELDDVRQALAKAVAAVTETTTARMTAEDAHHHAVAAAAEEKVRAESAVTRLESRLAAERSRAAEAEQHAVKLHREAEQSRQAAAAAEATIADLTAREAALRQKGTDEAEQSRAALAELTASLEAERTRVADSEARAAKLQHELDDVRQSLARALATVTEITTARMSAEDAQHRAAAAAADLAAKLEAERTAGEQARASAERLQRTYDDLRASMTEQLEAATAEIDAGRRRANELQRELAARDQQWDEKLNEIVAHMASDHEADIGQATLEKEEARAETRAAMKRLTTLQQAGEKWMAAQRERDRQQQQAINDLTRQLEELRAAAAAEIAALRGTPRRRVLVVHRDAALRALSHRALEPLGYEVLTAADGLEGLRVATAQKPDAVIAERLMPKMDGRAMMEFLKSRADTAGIRIALLTDAVPDAVALQTTVASVLEG